MGGRGAGSPTADKSSSKVGDKWVADIDKRRAAEAKQIQKEQAEQAAAAARIDAERQVFNPDIELRTYNLGNDGGYRKEYFDSYLKYRESKADEAWQIASKLKAGKEATFSLKILGNSGIGDETLRIRRQTKAEGGGIEVYGKKYMGVYSPRGRKNFIEEIRGW